MTTRFLPGIGRASYTAIEDQLARDLIADGHYDEVRFLHDLKVTFDARPVDDDSWLREQRALDAARRDVRQEAMSL